MGQMLACHLGESKSETSIAKMQGIVADLATDQSLLLPLRDLVSRPIFQALVPKAGSGGGALQRDALANELRPLYSHQVLNALIDFIDGFLNIPVASGLPHPVTRTQVEPPCHMRETSRHDEMHVIRENEQETSSRSLSQTTSIAENLPKKVGRSTPAAVFIFWAGAITLITWLGLVAQSAITRCSQEKRTAISYSQLLSDTSQGEVSHALILKKSRIVALVYNDAEIKIAGIEIDILPDLLSKFRSAKVDVAFSSFEPGARLIYLFPANALSSMLCGKTSLNSLPAE